MLRRTDARAAEAWRTRLRDELGGALAAGGHVHDVHRGRRLPGRPRVVTARLCELREIRLPLVSPFRTSFGVQTSRRILLVRAEVDVDGAVTEGWGECVAGDEPTYSSEYVDGAALVIREVLAPRLAAAEDVTAASVADVLGPVRGHPMAKAAIEMAVLDAELRAADRSFADLLGVTRDAHPERRQRRHPPEHRRAARRRRRLPRRRLRPHQAEDRAGMRTSSRVAAVRRLIGPDMPLQVDANAAYTRADIDHLARLDEFDLLLVEQPLPEDDLLGHAQLAAAIDTPVCLDESITSLTVAADAIELGAAEIVNIKAGRVGGYLTAWRIHDLCRERGVPVWCGGMLETGIGRAANAALAALDGFTLPGRRVGVAPVLGARHRHRSDRRRRRPRRRALGPRLRRRARPRLARRGDRPVGDAGHGLTTFLVHVTPLLVRRVDGRGQGDPGSAMPARPARSPPR